MEKGEVYSWRLSRDTKVALEHAARRENGTVAQLLDRIVQQWLRARRRRVGDDDAEQIRLHAAVAKTVGVICGSNPRRAEQARTLVRDRLKKQRAR